MKTKSIVKNSKQTDLSLPFNAWLKSKKMTTEQFRDIAKDKGLSLSFSTINSWRIGHKPRRMARAMLLAKFPGIEF